MNKDLYDSIRSREWLLDGLYLPTGESNERYYDQYKVLLQQDDIIDRYSWHLWDRIHKLETTYPIVVATPFACFMTSALLPKYRKSLATLGAICVVAPIYGYGVIKYATYKVPDKWNSGWEL